jgi:CRISPR-associated protein Csd1
LELGSEILFLQKGVITMLLKALYELAHSRKLLDELAFKDKPIRWVIELTEQGELAGQGPIQLGDKKKGVNKKCPRIIGDTNSGKVADFLAEGIDGMFGLSPDPKKPKSPEKMSAKRDHFWSQIGDCASATKEVAILAIAEYWKRQRDSLPRFLELQNDSWWVISSAGEKIALGNDEFTFSVNGKLVLEIETVQDYWRNISALKQEDESDEISETIRENCLITGDSEIVARTHSPKIKGVPNTLNNQGKLVSFEKSSPSFSSFGRIQSYNAPVSVKAATAYCIALNWLIEQRTHNFRLGGTIICFWAREHEESTEDFFAAFENPKPETIKKFLASPLRGEERSEIADEKFYSVTLAGNAGRIVVRHWLEVPLTTAKKNLGKWFQDLKIAPYGEPSAAKKKNDEELSSPLGLYRLAMTTVRESKDLQPEILTQLYRAALEAHAPSLQLLKPVLNRLAKQLVKDGPNITLRNLSRFALIRLIVNRNRKEGEPFMETKVCETSDAAYNCGRLLAIFDDLQMRANDYNFDGAGVVERYYGSASSAPNSAFGILWRLHQHHLKKVSRGGDRGKAAAEAIKRRIAEIAALFPQPAPLQPPQFPRTFSLVEQGRFALGFYQQKAADDAARKEARANTNQLKPSA